MWWIFTDLHTDERYRSVTASPEPGGGDVYAATHGRGVWRLNVAPEVEAVSPAIGRPAGGQTVTISGSNLKGAVSVSFGSRSTAEFRVLSASRMTVTTPAHATGTVGVRVANRFAVSSGHYSDDFSYQPSSIDRLLVQTARVLARGLSGRHTRRLLHWRDENHVRRRAMHQRRLAIPIGTPCYSATAPSWSGGRGGHHAQRDERHQSGGSLHVPMSGC